MDPFAEKVPGDFVDPTQLPKDAAQASKWQDANRAFWESNPMRYDWKEALPGQEFSREFFEEIDRRFLGKVHEFLPYEKIPFDSLIDFDALRQQDVLEIGVGNGSHAALLARHAKSFTGIDLTEYAVRSTSARFQTFGLNGRIVRMDAEQMEFPDASFDFIWSWGVIHHSSNTRRILEHMHRVLRPGGTAVVMVYHRSMFQYWIYAGLLHGLVKGRLFKTRSINQVLQQVTDGAIARFYTKDEWRKLVSDLFDVEMMRVVGQKPEFLPIPNSGIKRGLLNLTPNPVSRLFLNTMGQGSFLIARHRKRG